MAKKSNTGLETSLSNLSTEEREFVLELLSRINARKKIGRLFLRSLIKFDADKIQKSDMCKYLGISSSKLSSWTAQGCPVNVDNTISFKNFFTWYLKKMEKQKPSSKMGNFEKERIRKMSADAMLSELKVAKEENILVDRNLMLRSIERNISTCKQMIKGIPKELALLVKKKDRSSYLEEAEIKINDVLNALADTGELYESE